MITQDPRTHPDTTPKIDLIEMSPDKSGILIEGRRLSWYGGIDIFKLIYGFDQDEFVDNLDHAYGEWEAYAVMRHDSIVEVKCHAEDGKEFSYYLTEQSLWKWVCNHID